MAAPFPAPEPPLTIAPPRAPTAAPPNPPIAPSFTTSFVLLGSPLVAICAWLLHAVMADCGGTDDTRFEGDGAGGADGVTGTDEVTPGTGAVTGAGTMGGPS